MKEDGSALYVFVISPCAQTVCSKSPALFFIDKWTVCCYSDHSERAKWCREETVMMSLFHVVLLNASIDV